MDASALNYNPNANTEDNSCMYAGCTNPDAQNYNLSATIDDGSCIIVGCTVNAWFVCNYNPEATLNDWSLCEFDFSGAQCGNNAIIISDSDSHPVLYLSEVADDVIDAYYYLGDDRIGCMDKGAENYLESAVLDNESCIYLNFESIALDGDLIISVFPQPATNHISIDFRDAKNINNKVFTVHNIVGEIIYSGVAKLSRSTEIITENWTPGVYYIVIKIDNKNLTHRFVVE